MLSGFNGVKVFTATMHKERAVLGDQVTDWLRSTDYEVVDTQIRQSSDEAFHCLTIIVFYNETGKRKG